MVEPSQNRVPERYVPQLPAFPMRSLLRGSVFWLTKAHRTLAHAVSEPGNPAAVNALQKLARDAMPVDGSHADAAQGVIAEIFAFLTDDALNRQALQEARGWLQKLCDIDPGNVVLLKLRWHLLSALSAAADREAYVDEAKKFLLDANLAWEAHADAIRMVVGRLHAEIAREDCAAVIEAAAPHIRTGALLQSLLAICRCPVRFHDAEIAQQWFDRLDFSAVAVSSRVFADAWLIAARYWEALGVWKKMIEAAKTACEAVPEDDTARYWYLRALLQAEDHHVAARNSDVPSLSAPGWRRLQYQIALLRVPTLAAADIVTNQMQKDLEIQDRAVETSVIDGPPDCREWRLVSRLVSRALAGLVPQSVTDITASAEIASRVQSNTVESRWTEIYIAQKEIAVDGRFAKAVARLRADDGPDTPHKRDLTAIAEVMCGNVQKGTVTSSRLNADRMQAALRALLACENTGYENSGYNVAQLSHALCDITKQKSEAAFPTLRGARRALCMGLEVHQGKALRAIDAADDAIWSSKAPAWVQWLAVKAAVTRDAATIPKLLERGVPVSAANAWWWEAWICNFIDQSAERERLLQPVSDCLDAAMDGLDANMAAYCRRWRNVRQAGYRSAPPQTAPDQRLNLFPELGHSVGTTVAAEMRIETTYAQGRDHLAQRRVRRALRFFSTAQELLKDSTSIVTAWWKPVVQYWLGVAQAHNGDDAAADTLARLLDTEKADAARGQLALLKLRQGDIEAAKTLTDAATHEVAGIRYAKALVAAWMGRFDAAKKQLRGTNAARSLQSSAYAAFSVRLSATLDEAMGNDADARNGYQVFLSRSGTDDVVNARLARMNIRQRYKRSHAVPIATLSQTAAHLKDGAAVGWLAAYQNLNRLLEGEDITPQSLPGETTMLGRSIAIAWRQLMVHNLLADAKAHQALSLLEDHADTLSVPEKASHNVLRIWHTLSQLSTDSQQQQRLHSTQAAALPLHVVSQLLRAIRETDDLPVRDEGRTEDLEFGQWRQLAQFVLDAAGRQGRGTALAPTHQDLSAFAPTWPFGNILALWSDDAEVRVRAAAQVFCAPDLSLPGRPPEFTGLARAAAAIVRHDADEFLSWYRRTGPDLSNLPVAASDLWLTFAQLAFAGENFNEILDRERWASPADRTLPKVRLVLGLAAARAASLTHNPAHVHKLIQRGRSNLAPLLADNQRGQVP